MKAVIMCIALPGMLTACSPEPQPPSVQDYLDDRILLDAAMARCSEDRVRMKYEEECVVAREASNRIARREEQERRRELEAESARKRAALRRARDAADEARRLAAEQQRLGQEADYLSQFESAGRDDSGESAAGATPAITSESIGGSAATDSETGNASGEQDPQDATAESDLEEIREELRRRRDGS